LATRSVLHTPPIVALRNTAWQSQIWWLCWLS